jgi:tol-pal system protein YbgF
MRAPALLVPALAVLLIASAAPAAFAADDEKDPIRELDKKTDKRMDRLQKQIHDLGQVVLQGRATGKPVEVRIATDPDPALLALTPRLDDLEQGSRTLNSQVETLTHELDEARKDAAAAREQVKSLNARLDILTAKLGEVESFQRGVAAAGGAPPMINAPPPGQPQGQAEAEPAADPAQGYATGRKLFTAGDYAGAAAAFQAFIEQNGDGGQGAQARYWLGESFFRQGDYSDAATAYIGAIRGWPKTSWAPDAMVKLARSLGEIGRPKDVCNTLDEMNRRYPKAPTSVMNQAADARAKAQCAA